MRTDTNLFYAELPLYNFGLGALLSNEEHFVSVPANWHIVITDITNSTAAVLMGEHQTVNFLATGSIVAVLNIASKMKVDVPFFFGGDGASFIVPPCIIEPVMQALAVYKTNSLSNFNLDIRIGSVTVERIFKDGCELKIARHRRSSVFSMPVVLGGGLLYAEKLVKEHGYPSVTYPQTKNELDLSGMQCRWTRVAPPVNHQEVVALLVTAGADLRQSAVFRKVMQKIDAVYGESKKRQPISVIKLRLKTNYNSFGTEIIAKSGQYSLIEMIRAVSARIYSFIWFRTTKGKQYLEQMVEMSDTLVIDGKINTIICGTAEQRRQLQELLMQMESEKEIVYGLHSSPASIISCYVRNSDDAHIHFVDGAEGGYTEASKMLKYKLAGMAARMSA